MTSRHSKVDSPEEAGPLGARQCAYGYEIRSTGLWFEGDVLHIRKKFIKNERELTCKFNFATAYLPANQLHPKVTLLKDRPDLARIVVAVIDGYLLRQKFTKSTAHTAMRLAGTTVRFLEYCWLQDIYSLKEVTRTHWDALLQKYATGGWPLALDLERRASVIDLSTLRLSRRKHKKGVIEYSCASLLEAIGTNYTQQNLALEYTRGSSVGVLRRSRGDGAVSESAVTQIISHLNNLAELPRDMRALSLAHVNPYLYANSIKALPSNRTENFEPADLSALMLEAYRWVTCYSDPIIRLVTKVYGELSLYEQEEIDESRLTRMLEASETKELEQLLGVKIKSVRRLGDWQNGIGVLALVRVLLSSCFIILGVFNGRRKDEIQSRSVGLYSDGFKCLDQAMGLYQSYFYCEKTTQAYQLFFINESSFKALNVAKRLSDIAWNLAERNGGDPKMGEARKLFCMPGRGNENTPYWYDYSTDQGIDLLTARVSGKAFPSVPNAHMLRRAYAVVFHYRYENADLYALAQQLDHRDLAMTTHYVLEGDSRALSRHAASLWGDGGETKKARAALAAELAGEVADYAKTKLNNDVMEILKGTTRLSGGFPKLIHRFVRKMYGKIKYDDIDLAEPAQKVADVLLGRGHTVRPMAHGNCNAGPARPSAACFKEGRLARESASPLVCNSCPYHLRKEVHLRAIRDDLAWQREHLANLSRTTIQGIAANEALEATERLVAFYE